MPFTRNRAAQGGALVAAAAATLLSACSNERRGPGNSTEIAVPMATGAAGAPRQFGAEERAAARALSVGNSSLLGEGKGESEKARTCVAAIDFLTDRMRTAGILTADQQNALRAARRTYELRADRASGEATGTDDETAPPSDQMLARAGLGCLQALIPN